MQDTKYLLDPERKNQLVQLVVNAYAQQAEKEQSEIAEDTIDKPVSKRGLLATARQGSFQAPLTEQQKKNREAIKALMQGKPSNKDKE